MEAENAVMYAKKSNLSPEISHSEQSLHENKFSYRCLWKMMLSTKKHYSDQNDYK